MRMEEPEDVLFYYLLGNMIHYFEHSDKRGNFLLKFEQMGFRIGQKLSEIYSKEWPKFKTELDIIKFLCKDFWGHVFHKQIDNLKTNHHGTYLLQDNNFLFFNKISSKSNLEELEKYVTFIRGIIRGALHQLGIETIVTADIDNIPTCKMQIVSIQGQ